MHDLWREPNVVPPTVVGTHLRQVDLSSTTVVPKKRRMRGLELIEMAEAETCCGFGGTFATKYASISTAMGEVKCTSAAQTGAEVIVSNDSSCLMHIQGLLDRQGRPLKTMHLAEVLVQE